MGEQMANMVISLSMARRPDREKPDILSEKDLEDLRYNIAHLSPQSLRDFYARSHEECRLVYNRLPSPKKMQTLIQIWKQLWKWR
jgi:hypothetical protein